MAKPSGLMAKPPELNTEQYRYGPDVLNGGEVWEIFTASADGDLE